MKKMIFELNLNYSYDKEHKGAHYLVNGKHLNTGEFTEVATKSGLGYEAKKDANTAYNEGSDIPELNASVKSSRFTLTSSKLADTFEKSIEIYFQNVHSTVWIYATIIENMINLYFMNKEEFKSFLESFSSLNERGVIRGKATTAKMLAWLEGKVE